MRLCFLFCCLPHLCCFVGPLVGMGTTTKLWREALAGLAESVVGAGMSGSCREVFERALSALARSVA
jgi:hypothetical protein